jgi:hypothetical protein
MSSAFGQVAAVGEFAELFTVPSIYMRLERVSEWPNKSPEPTAVGAFRSAIAVHVAGRRWLSFLR